MMEDIFEKSTIFVTTVSIVLEKKKLNGVDAKQDMYVCFTTRKNVVITK